MNFAQVDPFSIVVKRDDRQRRDLTGIENLAASILANGLINPITITKENVLIAGERRLEAVRLLGLPTVTVQYLEDLSDDQMYLIEIEENVKRSDLTWQDLNTAYSIYHKKLVQMHGPEWTFLKTAEQLGINKHTLSKHLSVYADRHRPNSMLDKAETFNQAYTMAQRAQERRTDALVDKVMPAAVASQQENFAEPVIFPPMAEDFGLPPESSWDIKVADFTTWAEQSQQKFNFIHCDFPYGVNTGDKHGQAGGKTLGLYDDSFATYEKLIGTFLSSQHNFVAPKAHMIFWFAMNYYDYTKSRLEAGGWVVNPYPLIWHKTNGMGILPDKDRGPRRVYETAFLCSLGDKKIVRAVGNCVGGVSNREYHQSEKPYEVLHHFFRMVTDESTTFLDPTCGSGMAVKVAHALNAEYALGLELDEEFAHFARKNCSTPYVPNTTTAQREE